MKTIAKNSLHPIIDIILRSVKHSKIITVFILSATLLSCDVVDFLDVKPEKSLVIPSTVEDYQAILNFDTRFNSNYPYLNLIIAEPYYTSFNLWSTQSEFIRGLYVWERNMDVSNFSLRSEWSNMYIKVNLANIVLEGLSNVPTNSSNLAAWNNARGGALFFRSFAFYHLAQSFTSPYNPETAQNDLGIPLRFSADVEEIVLRNTLAETYDQIVKDLIEAENLLFEIPLAKTQASKQAATALLARVYQVMHNHEKALEYANKTLELSNTLLNYNEVSTLSNVSNFPRFHDEVIHESVTSFTTLLYRNAFVDTNLVASYHENDIRKSLYFVPANDNYHHFLGNYTGVATPFAGLALDEIYLIKAESEARLGDYNASMSTLNDLLINRWKPGTFVPFAASSPNEALDIVLEERYKSLLFRGLRWVDLRRLNLENDRAITLTRAFENGDIYELPPNDARYVLPIPLEEIILTGIEQNPR